MDLGEVMDNAVELPLDVDFDAASETEAIQAEGAADMGKHRFHDPQGDFRSCRVCPHGP